MSRGLFATSSNAKIRRNLFAWAEQSKDGTNASDWCYPGTSSGLALMLVTPQ